MKKIGEKLKTAISCLLIVAMVANTGIVVHGETTDSVDISRGLIAHYDFENVDGTSVPNTVDEETYTGTLSGNSVSIVDSERDRFGNALKFTGETASYMSIPSIVNTKTTSYSVSLWYKLDTSVSRGNKNMVLLQQAGGGRTMLTLTGANKYHTYVNTSDTYSDGTLTASDLEQWQHITFVCDAENQKVKFYINGVLDSEKSAGTGQVDELTDLLIGCHKNGGDDPMRLRGQVDEIRVYEGVVTDAQAKAIYEYKPSVDITTGMIAYYDFENVNDTSVPNKVDEATYTGALTGSSVSIEEETVLGKSLKFTGETGSYMSIPSIVNTKTTSYSVSLWYKLDTSVSRGNKNMVLLQQAGGGRTMLTLTGANKYHTYVNTADTYSDGALSASDLEQWQHITFVCDAANKKVKFYINGVLDSEKSAGTGQVDELTDLLIGCHKNGGDDPMRLRGQVDEIRVYEKIVTDEEAQAIYEDKANLILLAELTEKIAEAEEVYATGKLDESAAAAIALQTAISTAQSMTAANSYADVHAAYVGLEDAIDAYNDMIPLTLTVDTESVERTIDSDSIFGINHRYAFNGYGSFDSTTMTMKEDFVELYKDAGFGSIRYPGGTISNLFNWKTTIGPVEERKDQIHGFYNNSGQSGITPNFGIGEIATFADSVDSEIVYVYSLGRGNAQDAADLIEYLNAEVGTNPNGGIDWAAVRAENGHAKPYNVRYFEIGNEMNQVYSDGTSSQAYWLHGVANAETGYIEGGTATFTKQYAVCEEDWNQVASKSDGSANMVRYMRYANVNPKMYDTDENIVDDPNFVAVNERSVSVFVGDTQWTIVDNFENSGASDTHVVIDYSTGAILFGNGEHGAIPASGSQIYVSYSVDRDGFVDISRAIKETTAQINAEEGTKYEANVYSSYETSGFISKMAATEGYNDLYDGLTIHPYSGTPSGSTAEAWYDSAMSLAETVGIAKVQNYVNMLPEGKVPVISEYGIFRSTDTQVRSQTHAIYIAKVIMEYVRLGSPYIQKHCLIDWYSSGADSLGPTQQAVIQAVAQDGASTATGEGTFTFFSTPSAHVFKMLNSGFGDSVISADFDRVPEMDNGVDTVSALASKDDSGNIYIAIVNVDRQNDRSILLDVEGTDIAGRTVEVQKLASESITDENTPDTPDNVSVATEEFVATENQSYTVPKHSFVILKIAAEKTTLSVEAPTITAPKADAALSSISGVADQYDVSTVWTEVVSRNEASGTFAERTAYKMTATYTAADGYYFAEDGKLTQMYVTLETGDNAIVNLSSDQVQISDDGTTMTVSYVFATDANFRGGSLRKSYVDENGNVVEDYTDGSKTSIRFGYYLYDLEGLTLESWQWKWGTDAENLNKTVDGTNKLTATEVTNAWTSNLVIQNVPVSSYDAKIYSNLIITYTTASGEKVVIDTGVVSRTVCEVALAASKNPVKEGDDTYGELLLTAYNEYKNQ